MNSRLPDPENALAVASLDDRHAANAQPAGFLEHQARRNFRDLCRDYGFGGAREIIASIINDEAERKSA